MRQKLKYVTEHKRPGGYSDFYYRRNGQLQKIKGERHSDEFLANYARIHASFEDIKERCRGGFDHLCEQYQKSTDFLNLKESTRREYRLDLDRLRQIFGHMDLCEIKRGLIKEMQAEFHNKPGTANNLLRTMKKVLNFAVDMEYIPVSPAERIKRLKGGEHLPWTEEEITTFLEAETTPVQMRYAVLFALFTGQRVGDIIKMLWSDIKDGRVTVIQQKTGVRLRIPLHPKLSEIIPTMSKDNVNILTTSSNQRWGISNFKRVFKKASRDAGIPENKVFHGLRKNATVMLLEAGCSVDETKAITGHKTTAMIEHYGKGINQERQANAAMAKWSKSVTSEGKV
ncbi:MAG: tyrosine-type recombinase/integrase [Terasakiella sp.]|uniref:tyrosine-type recombinase/integrase n=1 Tax=unclassified Terasakiella TaxID=2614952 RepID=UPI003B00ED52